MDSIPRREAAAPGPDARSGAPVPAVWLGGLYLWSTVLGVVGIGGCGSADDPRPASWSYVSAAIMQPNCATVSCHSQAAAVSGLDFSDADRGYTSLTGLWVWIVDPAGIEANGCRRVGGQVVCQREHRSLVVPFDPEQSRLIHMLRAEGAPRMPPDRPLSVADIRLVEKWILEGARPGSGSGQQATDTDAAAATDGDPSDGETSEAGGPASDSSPGSDGGDVGDFRSQAAGADAPAADAGAAG